MEGKIEAGLRDTRGRGLIIDIGGIHKCFILIKPSATTHADHAKSQRVRHMNVLYPSLQVKNRRVSHGKSRNPGGREPSKSETWKPLLYQFV